jgi:hypothetical protein
MTMTTELAAAKLELDSHTLERAILTTELRVTIRETLLHAFNDEAKLLRKHAKEQHDAKLVDGRVAQTAEIDCCSISTATLGSCYLNPA